jgi:hypothetical protein
LTNSGLCSPRLANTLVVCLDCDIAIQQSLSRALV